jgi:hypothetical protein
MQTGQNMSEMENATQIYIQETGEKECQKHENQAIT